MDTSDPTSGVPPGMTMEIVEYFRDADIRVMMSIGGILCAASHHLLSLRSSCLWFPAGVALLVVGCMFHVPCCLLFHPPSLFARAGALVASKCDL